MREWPDDPGSRMAFVMISILFLVLFAGIVGRCLGALIQHFVRNGLSLTLLSLFQQDIQSTTSQLDILKRIWKAFRYHHHFHLVLKKAYPSPIWTTKLPRRLPPHSRAPFGGTPQERKQGFLSTSVAALSLRRFRNLARRSLWCGSMMMPTEVLCS